MQCPGLAPLNAVSLSQPGETSTPLLGEKTDAPDIQNDRLVTESPFLFVFFSRKYSISPQWAADFMMRAIPAKQWLSEHSIFSSSSWKNKKNLQAGEHFSC